jgi:hypothetical protein
MTTRRLAAADVVGFSTMTEKDDEGTLKCQQDALRGTL